MFYNAQLGEFSYCMSINPRRFNYMCQNFRHVGLKPPRLFKCIRWGNGSNMGCVLGHLAILRMAKVLNFPYVIVYEDDAYPRPDILWKWEQIQRFIPQNCGLLKLGNSSYRGKFVKLNTAIGYMEDGVAFGSHAYIIRNEMYDSLIDKMTYVKIPDGAMSFEHYKNEYYKPYAVTFEATLFIQKNNTVDNIISVKGGQRYWFPNETNNSGSTSGLPPRNFVDKLFTDDDLYCDKLCVVYSKQWKKGRKTAVVNGDRLITKDERGKLKKISEKEYELIWDNRPNIIERIVFETEVNGTPIYKITTNQD